MNLRTRKKNWIDHSKKVREASIVIRNEEGNKILQEMINKKCIPIFSSLPKNQQEVLLFLNSNPNSVVKKIFDELSKDKKLSNSSFYDLIRRLRFQGLIEETSTDPTIWKLSFAGEKSVSLINVDYSLDDSSREASITFRNEEGNKILQEILEVVEDIVEQNRKINTVLENSILSVLENSISLSFTDLADAANLSDQKKFCAAVTSGIQKNLILISKFHETRTKKVYQFSLTDAGRAFLKNSREQTEEALS